MCVSLLQTSRTEYPNARAVESVSPRLSVSGIMRENLLSSRIVYILHLAGTVQHGRIKGSACSAVAQEFRIIMLSGKGCGAAKRMQGEMKKRGGAIAADTYRSICRTLHAALSPRQGPAQWGLLCRIADGFWPIWGEVRNGDLFESCLTVGSEERPMNRVCA